MVVVGVVAVVVVALLVVGRCRRWPLWLLLSFCHCCWSLSSSLVVVPADVGRVIVVGRCPRRCWSLAITDVCRWQSSMLVVAIVDVGRCHRHVVGIVAIFVVEGVCGFCPFFRYGFCVSRCFGLSFFSILFIVCFLSSFWVVFALFSLVFGILHIYIFAFWFNSSRLVVVHTRYVGMSFRFYVRRRAIGKSIWKVLLVTLACC